VTPYLSSWNPQELRLAEFASSAALENSFPFYRHNDNGRDVGFEPFQFTVALGAGANSGQIIFLELVGETVQRPA